MRKTESLGGLKLKTENELNREYAKELSGLMSGGGFENEQAKKIFYLV